MSTKAWSAGGTAINAYSDRMIGLFSMPRISKFGIKLRETYTLTQQVPESNR